MCEYCDNGQQLLGEWVAGAKGYASVNISGNQLLLFELADYIEPGNTPDARSAIDWTDIRFCPMCGREL